jgi:hypothetical protein
MDPTCEGRLAEHRLRIARAEQVGPHLAEYKLLQRPRARRLAVRAPIGRALVAVGTWLQATPGSAQPQVTSAR